MFFMRLYTSADASSLRFMIKKFLKFIAVILLAVCLFCSAIIFQDEIEESKIFLWSKTSSEYDQHKNLIKPYFDEQFYLKHYGKQVKKSGLSALDHFLLKGWYSRDWHNHTDPNDWFNTTLHKERLWGVKKTFWDMPCHPFVDFLTQPKLSHNEKTVVVYANYQEIGRVWLAIEGLLRLNTFNVILHLPKNINNGQALARFTPQINRGLVVIFDNFQNKSFYHNDFIRYPDKYKLTNLLSKPEPVIEAPISYVTKDFSYLMHRLYNYTGWYKVAKINPTMINIAHYCDEPLISTRFVDQIVQYRRLIISLLKGAWVYPAFSQQDFKDYMVRIADGFDLCLLDSR